MEIDKQFNYGSVSEGQSNDMALLRAEGKMLAEKINNCMQDGREKSLAITKLEEAIFWANAGIARNYVA